MDKNKQSFLIKFAFASKVALGGLTLNPLRTALTVLGVTIGVASVVSLMGIGEGARTAVMEQFESLGTNVIKVAVHDPAYEFEPELAEDLVNRVQGMDFASPAVNVETQMKWKRDRKTITLLGTNELFQYIRDYDIVDGTFLSQYHIKLRANVAVLGYKVANDMMNGLSPVGRYVSLNGESYKVIGVIGEKGSGKADGIDDKIIIPYTCAQKISQKRTVEEIWCKANSTEEANLAIVQLGRIIKKKYRLGDTGAPSGGGNPSDNPSPMPMDGNMDFEMKEKIMSMENSYQEGGSSSDPEEGEDIITITNLNQMVEEADEANRIMSLLLGGIAAVSLLVGGLGIMNIMLVAVSERTVEIGLRRALGAQKTDLLAQFLLEALFVSIIGSFTGILLGIGGVFVFESYGFEAAISAKAILVATGVSLSCGIIFGVYPSISASSIPPVVALRRQ